MGRPKKWHLERLSEDDGIILKSGRDVLPKARSDLPLGAITKVSEAPEELRGHFGADVALLVWFKYQI